MPLLHEHQVLEGKYTVTRLLALGGMGEVYLGVNERIGKPVAIKVLRAEFAQDPAWVERFDREAKISARIRSEHVSNVFDLGELPSGERFIVMEYLEGESLAERLSREGRLARMALADLAVGILDGLVAAHTAGVVHRDLKPENVFLARRDRQDVVKLVDFGISMLVEPRSSMARQTLPGAVLGTPTYMSPEQARGTTGSIDHRTDIYSLGVILYEAASGSPPFDGESVNEIMFRIALDVAPELQLRVPGIDRAFVAIVDKALAKKPIDRYQSADAMRAEVLAWRAMIRSDDEIPISVDLGATGLTAVSELAPTITISSPRRRSRAWLAVPVSLCLGGVVASLGLPLPPSIGAALGRPSALAVELDESEPVTIDRTFIVDRASTLALSTLQTATPRPSTASVAELATPKMPTIVYVPKPALKVEIPAPKAASVSSTEEPSPPAPPVRAEPKIETEPPTAPAATTDI